MSWGVYQCVKDTIWKQITTDLRCLHTQCRVFISVSKIQFESKSQPHPATLLYRRRCLSVCQRYNLKANHNWIRSGNYIEIGVYQCVKDTIWKQITTVVLLALPCRKVFISVSKIQFESKSQHPVAELNNWGGCLSVCQRYNLKANHNALRYEHGARTGVYQCVKDTIWKQITTWFIRCWTFGSVFISVSKIQFESKSQLFRLLVPTWIRCLSVCQRYNLKANHNQVQTLALLQWGVYQCVKDTIWKQITTCFCVSHIFNGVFISVSKIQFESKSQLIVFPSSTGSWCLSVCQRYNLKANHNSLRYTLLFGLGVYQCVKDTIWKQITTIHNGINTKLLVFISVSKIQFESKSQRRMSRFRRLWWCLSVCQRYNLKANHNLSRKYAFVFWGVYQCVKDTIWKQITTLGCVESIPLLVFISVSKIQFESKSQRLSQ